MRGRWKPFRVMLAEYAKRRKRIWKPARDSRRDLRMAGGAFYAISETFRALSRFRQTGTGEDVHGNSKTLLRKCKWPVVPGEAFGAPGYCGFPTPPPSMRIDEGLPPPQTFFSSRAEAAS